MKKNNQIKPPSIKWILGGIGFLLVLFMLSTTISVQMRLSLNRFYQRVWNQFEPNSYVLKFSESWAGEDFLWEVYVVDGQPQWVQIERIQGTNSDSWFKADTVNVEEIFAFVESECIRRGFFDCGIRYNIWLRYPRKIVSYQSVIFEVTDFISCDKAPYDCAFLVPILEP